VELLREAFVIVIPSPEGSIAKPILARTTATGQLVWIGEKDLSGAAPSSPTKDVFLEAGKTYRYFWTRRGELCRAVWKLVKENPATAVTDHPFYDLKTEEQGRVQDFKSLGLKECHFPKMSLLVPGVDSGSEDQLTSGRRPKWPTKLLRGEQLSKLAPTGGAIEAAAFYVVARTNSLAAIFLADVLTALAADILFKTLEDRGILDAVHDIAKKATDDEVVAQLEEELMRGELFGQYFCRGEWHRAYYPYAHRCAKKKVPRDLFWAAVKASSDSTAWQEAALQIASEYSIPHPDYPAPQPKGLAYIWRVEVEPVLKIFDFYAFGFANVGAAWGTQLFATKTASERKMRTIKQVIGDLLRKGAPYQCLLQEIDAHLVEDFEERSNFHTKYLRLSVGCEYRWWNEFEGGFFDRVKPYSDWLSANSSKMADLLNAYFGDPKAIVEFNHLLQENVEEFEKMFKRMDDFDSHFGGKKVKRKLADGVQFNVDFKNNKLTIKTHNEEIGDIGPLYFVARTTQTQTREETQILRKGRVRIKKVESKTAMAIVPELPFKKIHHVPLWLGAFGDTLALAMALGQLGKDLNKAESLGEKIDVLGKTAGGVFSAIASVSDAINYTFICTTKIPWVIKMANPVSKAVEVVYNLKESYRLMTFGEESEIVNSLEKGESLDAVLLTTKGVVLWCSVIPGAAAFGGALYAAIAGAIASGTTVTAGVVGAAAVASGGTALPALAIGLAGAAIVVSGIDLVRYLRNGPENAMDPVAEKLKKALKEEFGSSEEGYAYSRTVHLLDSLCDNSKRLLAVATS
jgi:hypothetical protein